MLINGTVTSYLNQMVQPLIKFANHCLIVKFKVLCHPSKHVLRDSRTATLSEIIIACREVKTADFYNKANESVDIILRNQCCGLVVVLKLFIGGCKDERDEGGVKDAFEDGYRGKLTATASHFEFCLFSEFFTHV